jgi:acetyl-CoA carboxylase biotin carboxyl carrier protein
VTATAADVATDVTAPATAGLADVLAVLLEQALAFGTEAPQPPSRVRLEAAGVVVELDWSRPGPAPVAPAPVPEVPARRNGVPRPLPVRAAPPAPTPVETVAPPAGHRVTAPTVGVFYRSPEPGAPPFAAVGDTVTPGQQVAIIEAMKLMIPVEADRAGRVAEVLCADGDSVEYGQPLFVIADGG